MIFDSALDRWFLEGFENPFAKKSRRRRTVSTPPAPQAQPAPQALPAAPADRGKALLEDNFELIRQRLEVLGRRSGLPDHEADEFVSWALFRLVANQYRILGGWEGRSSFPTYLTVVLVNLMRDYRIHVWGKWRSSAAARQLGPEAVLLEKLLYRDGLPLEEAIRHMRMQGIALSGPEIERISEALPVRTDWRQVDEEELHNVAVDGEVEKGVEKAESASTAARLRGVLLPLLRELSTESRLVLKLYYHDGLTLATISRVLGRPQKELYRSRDRCLKKLRRHLEDAGLGAREVLALIGLLGDLPLHEDVWE